MNTTRETWFSRKCPRCSNTVFSAEQMDGTLCHTCIKQQTGKKRKHRAINVKDPELAAWLAGPPKVKTEEYH